MHRKYPSSAGWVTSDHLLATLIDAVQALFNLTLAANSENGRYDPPQLVARPGDAERCAAERRLQHSRGKAVLALVDQLLPRERR